MESKNKTSEEYSEYLELAKKCLDEKAKKSEQISYKKNDFMDMLLESNAPSLNRYISPVEIEQLNDYIYETTANSKSFQEALFSFITEKGMSFLQCYKKACVSKSTASKIKNDIKYKPSKTTVVAFALALKLNLEETEALLKTVSMSLSDKDDFDAVIKAFISHKHYNIYDIDQVLYELGLDTFNIGIE